MIGYSPSFVAEVATIVAAITAKKFRGEWIKSSEVDPGVAYVELMNVAGPGKLLMVTAQSDGTGAGNVYLTIDGNMGNGVAIGNNETKYIIFTVVAGTVPSVESTDNYEFLNAEFENTCVVFCNSTAGTISFESIHQVD